MGWRRARTALAAALVWAVAAPATASAHAGHGPAGDAFGDEPHGSIGFRGGTITEDGSCSGDPINPDQVIEGSFGTELRGAYVMVPFDVPRGLTSLRVKYCYSRSSSPLSDHTIDLGLYEPRSGRRSEALWGPPEFRGHGGSSHPDVTLSPQGFSGEEQYLEAPRAHTPGRTTRGFIPGEVPDGTWAAELGVASVVGPDELGPEGRVDWRLEIEHSRDPDHAARPYRPALYDDRPRRSGPGWYQGDLHVHAEHSALGDATMRETFDFAFGGRADGKAGLDFVTLNDYVTPSAWPEIQRQASRHPRHLVIRSSEVITYRGHMSNSASGQYVDHRTGPVYEWEDGAAVRRRGERPASEVFDDILGFGGWTQINHPTIFPSAVPGFRSLCRGCPWDYSGAETDWGKVDAIEVHTGPGGLQSPEIGPNPFTLLAIPFYERALATGARIAAVAVSDSHHAGRSQNPITQSPIGQGTTAVFAEELSECGISTGIQRGHTYAKVFSSDAPDLRFEARADGMDEPAIFGDTVRAEGPVRLTAEVSHAGRAGRPGPLLLTLYRDGVVHKTRLIAGDGAEHVFTVTEPGRYRVDLTRGTTIEVVGTPIWIERGSGGLVDRAEGRCRESLELGIFRRRSPLGVARNRFNVGCRAEGAQVLRLRRCSVRVRARARGRLVTIGRGSREAGDRRSFRVSVRLNSTGRRLLARTRRGFMATIEARGTDGLDVERVARSRVRLRPARR